MVRTLEASGGDPVTDTPAFEPGDTFAILTVHANGWLEVAEGYLWPTWVEPVSDEREDHAIAAWSLAAELADPDGPVTSTSDPASAGLLVPSASLGPSVELSVPLTKIDGSFGLQIVGGVRGRLGVYVKALRKGGAAALEGSLQKYDELIEVDGRDFTGCTHDEAVAFLAVRLRRRPTGSRECVGSGVQWSAVEREDRGFFSLLYQGVESIEEWNWTIWGTPRSQAARFSFLFYLSMYSHEPDSCLLSTVPTGDCDICCAAAS